MVANLDDHIDSVLAIPDALAKVLTSAYRHKYHWISVTSLLGFTPSVPMPHKAQVRGLELSLR